MGIFKVKKDPDFLPIDEFQPRGVVGKFFARIRNTYLLVSVLLFLLVKLVQIKLAKNREAGRRKFRRRGEETEGGSRGES